MKTPPEKMLGEDGWLQRSFDNSLISMMEWPEWKLPDGRTRENILEDVRARARVSPSFKARVLEVVYRLRAEADVLLQAADPERSAAETLISSTTE